MIAAVACVLTLGACHRDRSFELTLPERFEGNEVVLATYDDSIPFYTSTLHDGPNVLSLEIADSIKTPLMAQIMIDGHTSGYFILEPGKASIADGDFLATGTKENDRFVELMKASDEYENDIDMTRYVALMKRLYGEHARCPFGIYFAVEAARFSELATIDSLLAVGGDRLKNSHRIARYHNAARLRDTTRPGVPVTDFEAVQPDGKTLRLTDITGHGKYVVVDFWASWCKYCIMEIPALKQLYDKYKDRGLEILGVAVNDAQEDTAESVKENSIPWPVMYNAGRTPNDIYGITGIPHLMLVSPTGEIISRGEDVETIDARLSQVI